MADLSLDTKKSLLGQKGVALVQRYLYDELNVSSVEHTDVLHPEIDMYMYHPKNPKVPIPSQVKCKVPWIYEEAQSFTPSNWNGYLNLRSLWIVCVPAPDKYSSRDQWAGNVYHFTPKNVNTISKTTNNGREMILLPLQQFSCPTFKIEKQFDLDQLKRFSTEED